MGNTWVLHIHHSYLLTSHGHFTLSFGNNTYSIQRKNWPDVRDTGGGGEQERKGSMEIQRVGMVCRTLALISGHWIHWNTRCRGARGNTYLINYISLYLSCDQGSRLGTMKSICLQGPTLLAGKLKWSLCQICICNKEVSPVPVKGIGCHLSLEMVCPEEVYLSFVKEIKK